MHNNIFQPKTYQFSIKTSTLNQAAEIAATTDIFAVFEINSKKYLSDASRIKGSSTNWNYNFDLLVNEDNFYKLALIQVYQRTDDHRVNNNVGTILGALAFALNEFLGQDYKGRGGYYALNLDGKSVGQIFVETQIKLDQESNNNQLNDNESLTLSQFKDSDFFVPVQATSRDVTIDYKQQSKKGTIDNTSNQLTNQTSKQSNLSKINNPTNKTFYSPNKKNYPAIKSDILGPLRESRVIEPQVRPSQSRFLTINPSIEPMDPRVVNSMLNQQQHSKTKYPNHKTMKGNKQMLQPLNKPQWDESFVKTSLDNLTRSHHYYRNFFDKPSKRTPINIFREHSQVKNYQLSMIEEFQSPKFKNWDHHFHKMQSKDNQKVHPHFKEYFDKPVSYSPKEGAFKAMERGDVYMNLTQNKKFKWSFVGTQNQNSTIGSQRMTQYNASPTAQDSLQFGSIHEDSLKEQDSQQINRKKGNKMRYQERESRISQKYGRESIH
ncbi:UNKNOWN [Stylonychia lemnae]|uniref:C2 domain-containing protein n=1 Tax=Stylonychia lemnae TaxID=5949 RepID=A0A078BAA1_STYLE|nr:UNKNOWN [Stylonychia lemnae]|eukprot:CDW90443.1 UNKNOWN [Stylonychia lemnae]